MRYALRHSGGSLDGLSLARVTRTDSSAELKYRSVTRQFEALPGESIRPLPDTAPILAEWLVGIEIKHGGCACQFALHKGDLLLMPVEVRA
ncbi:hypothetical protein STBA_60280 [Streptomyces sp. MP131-18]|nr:hypothetical protein STBA_60280 [Streptomyces sp. MP131-18]